MNTRRWVMTICLCLIAAGGWLFYRQASLSARGGEQSPLYSIRRHDPYGTAALYQLLHERGGTVESLEHARPLPGQRGVLIQIVGPTPLEDTFSSGDEVDTPRVERPMLHVDSVMDWMAQGNTVVQFAAEPTPLMQRCGVEAVSDINAGQWRDIEKLMRTGAAPEELPAAVEIAAVVDIGDGEVEGIEALSLLAPAFALSTRPTPRWQPLAKAGGRVVAGQMRVGAGELIIVASPWPIMNSAIANENNLDFVRSIIDDRPVVFDEWSLGIGGGGSIMALLRRVGLIPALLQFGLVIALYSWSTRRRTPQHEVPIRRRSAAQQIVMLGHLYHRSMPPEETLVRARLEVHRRLAGALRCPVHELDRRLARLDTKDAQRIRERLASIPRPRPAEVRCLQCGYLLRGNLTGVCPECHREMAPWQKRAVAAGGDGAGHVDVHHSPEASTGSGMPERRKLEKECAALLAWAHGQAKELARE